MKNFLQAVDYPLPAVTGEELCRELPLPPSASIFLSSSAGLVGACSETHTYPSDTCQEVASSVVLQFL